MKTTKHITIAGQAVTVERDGTVRAWDEVAGHYSVHHGLTVAQVTEAQSVARTVKTPEQHGYAAAHRDLADYRRLATSRRLGDCAHSRS